MSYQVSIFKTVDVRLNFGLFLSVYWVLIFEFIYNADQLGFEIITKATSIISNLCLAFIASYIFYIVVIHLKYVKDRERLDPYINLKNQQLVSGIKELISQLSFKAGVNEEFKYPSKNELADISERVNLSDQAPKAYQYFSPNMITMQDFFLYWKSISVTRVDDILKLSQFLDSEQYRIILTIYDSRLFFQLNMFDSLPRNGTFKIYSDALYDLSRSVKCLEEYCKIKYPNVTPHRENNEL